VWGLALAISPAAFDYVSGTDWTQLVSPTWAPVVAGAITIALRYVTTTPIFNKE
jgi:hypothetical protein